MGGDHNTAALTALADLASVRVGGRIIAANDEFFAPARNLLKPERAIFIPGKFTARGKWMDGWESRRRRTPGHDWCVIRLAARGTIKRVEVDTAHFKGNFPESCSLEVREGSARPLAPEKSFLDFSDWRELLPRTKLQAHTRHFYEAELSEAGAVTHALFRIYPDGGVSRLRLYGSLE